MPTQRVGAVASGVALPLSTETLVATVTPLAPNNQVDVNVPSIQVQATIILTGAVGATTCTLRIRRGSGTGGVDILPTDPTPSVDAAATDREVTVTVQETPANFNATNGQYTLTATANGAAQTARLASLEIQDLAVGV